MTFRHQQVFNLELFELKLPLGFNIQVSTPVIGSLGAKGV